MEEFISYVERVRQTLTLSHHAIREQRHMVNFLSVFIHKKDIALIIRRGPLHTPQNHGNRGNRQNTMPRTVHLRPGHGFKASAISRVLHPSDLIRGKWSNTWHRERVAGLVFVGRYLWVVRRGIPATDAFIMRHEYFPNKELYDTKRMVHITEEGPKEGLFDL